MSREHWAVRLACGCICCPCSAEGLQASPCAHFCSEGIALISLGIWVEGREERGRGTSIAQHLTQAVCWPRASFPSFLPLLRMWLGCVSLVGPGSVHSSVASVFLLAPPSPVVSGRSNSRVADRPLGWHFLSSAVLPQPELPSGTRDALVTVFQVPSTHCVPGPPGAGEAMGSLVHGEILVWTWVSLTGTSSRSPHLPVLVSVQPEQLCLAAAGPA